MSAKDINNFPESTRILTLQEPFFLIDVGARRGFHPVFNSFNLIEKIGFEPNQDECDLLNAKSRAERERYFPVALGNKTEERLFYHTRNAGSSGFLRPNDQFWSRISEASLDLIGEEMMGTVTLDEFASLSGIKDVDFLKIDTEGFEQEVLEGGEAIISKNALGVLCEVYFNPVREGGAKFSDICDTLERFGLSLYHLSQESMCRRAYIKDKGFGAGNAAPGQLIWGDALFLRDPLASSGNVTFKWSEDKYRKIISLYEIFNLDDCAYELICHLEASAVLTNHEVVSLKAVFLKKQLRKKILNFVYRHGQRLFKYMPTSVRKVLRKAIR